MINNEPFVNIIILNFNNYKDTYECVESLKKIEYKNWKITLLDNGSKDGSLEKLKKRYFKDKKIKFMSNKSNQGFARGNNQAMEEDLFNADYFLLINNDVIVDKKFLKNLIKEGEDLVSPMVYNYYSRDELSKNDYPGKFNFFTGGGIGIKPREKTNKIDYASGCCWLINKNLFKETGGFNEEYFAYNEEIEWAYRLKLSGHYFHLCSSSKIWHKGAKTSSKISGLKIKLLNRNQIWFEREYAKKYEFFFFIVYLFLYKTPKNLVKIMAFGNEVIANLKSLFLGIKEGLLSDFISKNKKQNKNVRNKRI